MQFRPQQVEHTNNQSNTKKNRFTWLVPLVIGLMIAFLFRQFFFDVVRVNGSSMTPNLQNNELVISWRMSQINRGSVVIFDAHDEDTNLSSGSSIYVKRVIGLPGDKIEYKNGKLYVNSTEVNQDYIDKKQQLATSMGMDENAGWSLSSLSLSLTWQDSDRNTDKVPKNSYFVLGDNRSVSKDSRQFGFISKSHILGVVQVPFWNSDISAKKYVNNQWKSFFVKKNDSKKNSSKTTISSSENLSSVASTIDKAQKEVSK